MSLIAAAPADGAGLERRQPRMDSRMGSRKVTHAPARFRCAPRGASLLMLCKQIGLDSTKYLYLESTGTPLSIVNTIEVLTWPKPQQVLKNRRFQVAFQTGWWWWWGGVARGSVPCLKKCEAVPSSKRFQVPQKSDVCFAECRGGGGGCQQVLQ